MKTKFLALWVLVLAVGLAPSCNQKESNSKKVATLNADRLDIKKIRKDIVEVIVSLPDSYETVHLINETGASFIAGLTQEGMSTGELLTRAEKAKSYGYVMFDMAYANTYNQTNSFSKLLDIHKKLTQELGFEALLSEHQGYQEKYMENKDDREEVDRIVSELLNETNSFIQENGSASDISLVFAGVTAKSLYVMSSLTLFALNNSKLIDLLKKQGDRVMAAISILDMVPDNAEVKKMAEALKPVSEIYSSETFDGDSVEKINGITKVLFE